MKQKGFTLIELVVVIVILGILAATALPKFVDLSSDAEKAAADAVLGASQSVCALNFAKNRARNLSPTIVDGAALIGQLDPVPTGWAASGGTIAKTAGGTTYTVTLSPVETTASPCSVAKSW